MKFLTVLATALLSIAAVDAICVSAACDLARKNCADIQYQGGASCQGACFRAGKEQRKCQQGCAAVAAADVKRECTNKYCDLDFLILWNVKEFNILC
ncbi:MAG: hypothetical protein BYD32DRAFT_402054 [Podila humilis]|nr:MAG: hypothetical protein BYD32DRAFT_402054 [Podila humilis]